MKRPIFLSSALKDSGDARLRIRELVGEAIKIRGTGADAYRPVWMAEDFPAFEPASSLPALEKVQLCLDGVREAECFVAVITNRHGSEVSVDGVGNVPTTYLEAELFEAAVLGKPAFVFILEGNEPEPRLNSLLKLLEPFFPNISRRPVSEGEIVRQVEGLVRHYDRPKWLRPLLMPPKLRQTVRALAALRHRPYDVKAGTPSLRFLKEPLDPNLPPPDANKVELLLERADIAATQQARLTMLWFAIRELTGAPFTDPRFSDFTPLWDRALGAWRSAGAWYGLHAHVELGCLAALGSVCEIRKNAGTAALPHGALASEYYSIASLMRSQEMFALSLRHVEEAIALAGANPANAIAIRGSIYRRMGHLSAAIDDYRFGAERKRDEGGAAYGEALSELGYAETLNWDLKRGISHMEEGLGLLNEQVDGFTIRAMRKLAYGYARAGRVLSALDLSNDAYDVAMKLGAYDQIGRVERLAHWIGRARGQQRSTTHDSHFKR
jgi:tetratricopeptide (TPR) repeat protein